MCYVYAVVKAFCFFCLHVFVCILSLFRPGLILILSGMPLKTVKATFNPRATSSGSGIACRHIKSLPPFNPKPRHAWQRLGPGSQKGTWTRHLLTLTGSESRMKPLGAARPPPPTPNTRHSVQKRQSAQAKAQLISCHRERAPFNPCSAKLGTGKTPAHMISRI